MFHSFHVSMSSCGGLKSGTLEISFFLLSKTFYGLSPVLDEACAKGKAFFFFRGVHTWMSSSVGPKNEGKVSRPVVKSAHKSLVPPAF